MLALLRVGRIQPETLHNVKQLIEIKVRYRGPAGGKGNRVFGGITHQVAKFTPGPLSKVRAQDF